MKKLLILGAGTAGTIMANKMAKKLNKREWEITIVDQYETHYYQPGFLFIPFGVYVEKDVIKQQRAFLPSRVNVIQEAIDLIEPANNRVMLKNGQAVEYDYLIIATGTQVQPAETDGMLGDHWYKDVFDFYTVEGAVALAEKLKNWDGGKMVVNIVEMPIKCPVAPLEFVFLADWFFTKQGIRDKVEIEFVTPLPAAFTKPKAAGILGNFLEEKKINLTTDFSTGRVDGEGKKLVSWDEQEIDYDILVTIPTNMGDESIARSGLGDELNFIPTDKQTLQIEGHENIFALGDCTNLPSSKAGSVAHFQGDVLTENLLDAINGRELSASFDGHANCYIESGFGKGILIDFNYTTEPLPGKFPMPLIGPFKLLGESKMNHWGKLAFRWIYWNLLLKGVKLPISSQMTMTGKIVNSVLEVETSRST
jgi:sulfide:quinone oxidoreductase